jgi:hypothetical protein
LQAKQDSVATQAAVERTGMYSQRVLEGSTRTHIGPDLLRTYDKVAMT